MVGKSSRTSTIAAAVVVIVNFVVIFACLVVFTVSLWMISSPSTLAAVIESTGNPTLKTLLPTETLTIHLGIASCAVATFVFFVSFMGLYGTITKSQYLLFMYSALVLLLLLLECALIYYFVSNFMEKGFRGQDGQWTHMLRLAFECCEHNATSMPSPLKIPWSCCGAIGHADNCTAMVYRKDCYEVISVWLQRYQTSIYASLAAIHIVLSSCSLLRRSRSLSRSYS